MTPADIRKWAGDLPSTASAYKELLQACADLYEAAYVEEDAAPMYAALARLEALKP